MSFIDIEYDCLTLSTSPILNTNYFPKKFYRLYQSINFDHNIIINGSFLYNDTNKLYTNENENENENVKVKRKSNKILDLPYYKNIDKLYIHTKTTNFYINIDRLEIENNNEIINNIVYQSNIKKEKDIKYRDFVILLSTPILINISYNTKNGSNFVTISCINDNSYGGSSHLYPYNKHFSSELSNIESINLINQELYIS
jgi:hypothetical protein